MNPKSIRSHSILFFKCLLIFLTISFHALCAPALAKDIYPCLSTLWSHEKSDLEPDPALIFGKLPNGFRYVLMENHEPRNRVSIQLNIQAGSLHEAKHQEGIAHFLEHMVFNGSTHFEPGELIKYFQSIGMSFGPDANGHTSFDETVYNILLPDGTKESIQKGLIVMQDYAEGAFLTESEIERERGIILAEKRVRDSVGYRTYMASMKFLFDGSKIPLRMPIGDEDDIQNANHEILKDYYDTWYRPENMILVMVGDFKKDVAEPLIKSSFEKLAARAPARNCPDMGTVKHEGIKTFYHYEKEAGNTETSLQVIWDLEPVPDNIAYQKERLTQYAANSILNNRFKAMTENPENPFTSASAYSGIFLNHVGYAEISAESAPENWKKVLPLLEQTLRQTLEYGFTHAELERVKKDFLAELEDAVSKKETRNSSKLSRLIIRNLNNNRVFQSPEQEKALYAPFIESLTIEDVHKAFVKLWNQNHRLILVTGNASIGGENSGVRSQESEDRIQESEDRIQESEDRIQESGVRSQESGVSQNQTPNTKHQTSNTKHQTPNTKHQTLNIIQQVFEASQKIPVRKPEQKQIVQFPYLPEPEDIGEMRQRTEIFDLGIEQIDYENGLRLNLKKTDFKKNKVIVNVCFGFGKKSEPTPGLALLTESLINKSGLGKMTRNELERALAGKKTSVRFKIKENAFLLKGETIPEEIPLLFQLFYAYIKDPGYRKEAYLLTMRQFEQMYQELSHFIEGAMELSGNRFLAGGDTRFGMPPYKDFQKLTLEQARSWIDSVKDTPLEISVVGDFEPETVKYLVARYFGPLSFAQAIEDKIESLSFPAGKKLVIEVDTKLDKGIVVMAWHTEDFSNIHRVRRLSVLGQIVSDRLREEIREKSGATYSQYAYNQSSRTYQGYGVFRCLLSIDPNMSDEIIQQVKQIVADLIEKGITEDELRRAVDPILTSLKDMVRTNDYWLNTVLSGSDRSPDQLDWSRTIQKDYAAITVQDVSDLATTYLDNKKTGTIIIRPMEPKKSEE